MIYHSQNITRDILLKHLSEGMCSVTFVKVKDNTTRTILCTLAEGVIPSKFEMSIKRIYTQIPDNADIVPIWDIKDDKWKSFKISKVIEFRTFDELSKQDLIGQDNNSDIGEFLRERTKKIQSNFDNRIKSLNEKRKSAIDKMNKKGGR